MTIADDVVFCPAMDTVMSPAQLAAARTCLTEENSQRHHLVVYLSGSHAYGFPSPDSDLDLKAVHIAPARALLGLNPPKLHRDRLEVIDGIEVDYTSNELAATLRGILAGNGNYIERVLGELSVMSTPQHEALQPLVRAALSRRVFRHYAGFAGNQRKAVDERARPAAKKVLYVLRTALTGTHLLKTGRLVVDVRELLDEYDCSEARDLIAIKLAGERTELEPSEAERWKGTLDRVMALLEAARDGSCLPEEPQNAAQLEDWLLDIRRSFW